MNSLGEAPPTTPTRIFHSTDKHGSVDDIFGGGQSQIGTNPAALSWKIGGPNPAKNDINNVLVYIAEATSGNSTGNGPRIGDTWITMAGDRAVENGNSFISFQFLQKPVAKNATNGFTTAGTDGGRTVGDVQVTAEFVSGGTTPNLYFEEWKGISPNFGWVSLGALPAGAAFGTTNGPALTNVPYMPFGLTSYATNLFAEISVDISAVYRLVSTGCAGKISTLWVVTKTSQSPTANITDFVEPIPLNLNLTTPVDAGPDRAICVGSSTTIGTAVVADPSAPTTFAWRLASAGPTSTVLSTDAQFVVSPTATTEYTLTATRNGCPKSDNVIVTVNPNPTASAGTAPAAQCFISTGNTFRLTGSGSNGTPSWAVVPNINNPAAEITGGDTFTPSVKVTGSGSVTLRLTVTSPFSCGTPTSDVTLTVNPNPTASAGATPAAQCFIFTGNTFSLDGSGTNGAPSWTVVSKSPTTLSASFSDATIAKPTVTVTGGSGTVTLRLTVTSAFSCGTATSDVTITVNAQAAPPEVSILRPDLCSTTTASLALIVTNAEYGEVTYTLTQPNLSPMPAAKTFKTALTQPTNGPSIPLVLFENLVPGGGYNVTATKGLCVSGAAVCLPPVSVANNSTTSTSTVVGTKSIQTEAYPNPTSQDATIIFSVPKSGRTVVGVYDALGRPVATLFDGEVTGGEQRTVILKGERLSSGDYFYRVTADGKTKTSRISLTK